MWKECVFFNKFQCFNITCKCDWFLKFDKEFENEMIIGFKKTNRFEWFHGMEVKKSKRGQVNGVNEMNKVLVGIELSLSLMRLV